MFFLNINNSLDILHVKYVAEPVELFSIYNSRYFFKLIYRSLAAAVLSRRRRWSTRDGSDCGSINGTEQVSVKIRITSDHLR